MSVLCIVFIHFILVLFQLNLMKMSIVALEIRFKTFFIIMNWSLFYYSLLEFFHGLSFSNYNNSRFLESKCLKTLI